MAPRFLGRTVIVTGASAGIGAGCARRFAAEGANVVLAARREDRLAAIADQLDPARTLTVVADVTDRGDVDALVAAAVARFGAIDVLVSNVGRALVRRLADISVDEWRDQMARDVESCFHGAQAALPHLRASRGAIVHVASVSGLGGDWNFPAYNAAKGAVVNFTRALALDLGRDGIRVNAVAPSLTETETSAPAIDNPAYMARFEERTALGGHGTPADVAAAVAFLASAEARFITGVILPVDGGISASCGQPAPMR